MEGLWLAALLVGLAGGVHCAGMCGGIVTALSLARAGERAPVRFALAYNAGRLSSYAIAGAVAGLLGQGGLALRGNLAIHQGLFAFASLALIASGLYLTGVGALVRRLEAAGSVIWRRIEPWSRPLFPVVSTPRALALGALWGWLPCGMVYGVLLLALAAGSPLWGALTMLAFGFGTLPNLLAVAFAARRTLGRAVAPRWRMAAGLVVIGLGLYGFAQLAAHQAGFAELCRLPIAS